MEKRKLRGMNLIRVRGTPVERARAHATLLREEIHHGAIPALANKNEWLIRRSPGPLQNRILQEAVVWLYKRALIPYMHSRLTQDEKQTIAVFAETTGLSYEVCRESLFQADALMLLAKTSVMKHLLPEWIPGGLPGCTSGIALKDWTENKKLLVGRNFDYLIVGPWEENTTVVFNEPSDSNLIPFVNITTAGVHTAGLTAMNREGITISTHAHFGRHVSFAGRPIITIGDEIIQKAKTLDQAIDMARKIKPIANWAFIMASAKENRGIVIEMSPSGVHVRETTDGFLAHSNYYHASDLREKEALLCGAYCEDLKGRICQMRDLLTANRGHLKASHITAALGDQRDHFNQQERIFGNTLSVITTVKSVVFEPESLRFWVADRKESPVGLGDFTEISMDRFWNQPLEEYEKSMEVLPGYRPKNPALLEGIKHYRQAYRAHHNYSHEPDYLEKTMSHIRKALQAYTEDAHLWIQAGLVAFKMNLFEEAQTYFEKSQTLETSHHVSSVRDLYLARCMDLTQKRSEALQIYQRNLKTHEPKLKRAFRKGVKRPYRSHESARILLDLQFPDSFQY